MLGEFYRRNGGWKERCVGQAWDSGLRGSSRRARRVRWRIGRTSPEIV
ncbi:hypothetical protein [Nocardia farcinica]|nr:hypothetical protein [Nocardia farcinica]